MYTPIRRTNLKYKILFEDRGPMCVTCTIYSYSIVRSNNISILFKFIYIFLRESSRKMCSKTHQVSQSTTNALPHYSKNILNRPPPKMES